LLAQFLWLTIIEKCASSNHRKSVKEETSRQIPQKLATRVELVLL